MNVFIDDFYASYYLFEMWSLRWNFSCFDCAIKCTCNVCIMCNSAKFTLWDIKPNDKVGLFNRSKWSSCDKNLLKNVQTSLSSSFFFQIYSNFCWKRKPSIKQEISFPRKLHWFIIEIQADYKSILK